jgi:hypothetical protein
MMMGFNQFGLTLSAVVANILEAFFYLTHIFFFLQHCHKRSFLTFFSFSLSLHPLCRKECRKGFLTACLLTFLLHGVVKEVTTSPKANALCIALLQHAIKKRFCKNYSQMPFFGPSSFFISYFLLLSKWLYWHLHNNAHRRPPLRECKCACTFTVTERERESIKRLSGNAKP